MKAWPSNLFCRSKSLHQNSGRLLECAMPCPDPACEWTRYERVDPYHVRCTAGYGVLQPTGLHPSGRFGPPVETVWIYTCNTIYKLDSAEVVEKRRLQKIDDDLRRSNPKAWAEKQDEQRKQVRARQEAEQEEVERSRAVAAAQTADEELRRQLHDQRVAGNVASPEAQAKARSRAIVLIQRQGRLSGNSFLLRPSWKLSAVGVFVALSALLILTVSASGIGRLLLSSVFVLTLWHMVIPGPIRTLRLKWLYHRIKSCKARIGCGQTSCRYSCYSNLTYQPTSTGSGRAETNY